MSLTKRLRFGPLSLVVGVAAVVVMIAVNDARTAELRRQLEVSNSFGRELDGEHQVIATRRAAKRAVARELAEGNTTLEEAAARFLALDGGPGTEATALVKAWLPAPTELASEARSAVLIAAEVVPDPAERDRVTSRLRADLARFASQ